MAQSGKGVASDVVRTVRYMTRRRRPCGCNEAESNQRTNRVQIVNRTHGIGSRARPSTSF